MKVMHCMVGMMENIRGELHTVGAPGPCDINWRHDTPPFWTFPTVGCSKAQIVGKWGSDFCSMSHLCLLVHIPESSLDLQDRKILFECSDYLAQRMCTAFFLPLTNLFLLLYRGGFPTSQNGNNCTFPNTSLLSSHTSLGQQTAS